MPWDPAQYLKFAGPRLRPAVDLLQHVDCEAPGVVYDLGCGAGNVTRLIAARWPQAKVVGVDRSAEMLAKAAAESPSVEWQQADLGQWRPDRQPDRGRPDVIYSNAALHWLDDHDRLFPDVFARLAPGGILAVQMPRNFGAKSHTSITETALNGPWRSTLEPLLRPSPVRDPEFYYDLLAPCAARLDMWETEYLQVLEGDNPVKEWTKGTWLSPLLDALPEAMRGQFEAAYGERVAGWYPKRSDGKTLFPFRRMFIVATAP